MSSSIHTLIIRTRNRKKWINQALDDYHRLNHIGTIHVEDDSTDKIFEENRVMIESYKDVLDIKHFKGFGSQEDTRSKRVLVTTRKSLDRVKTKYYSFQSDDDLFFSSFIYVIILS